MSDFATGAAVRSTILGQLSGYYSQVAVEVADAESDWFTPSNSVSGWKSALKVYAALIERLRPGGDIGLAAMAGQSGHDFWVSNAKNVSAGLSNIRQAMGGARFSWSRAWDEVVVQSAKDVGTTAIAVKDAALPATFGLLGLVVVGLIAIAAIQLAPVVRS